MGVARGRPAVDAVRLRLPAPGRARRGRGAKKKSGDAVKSSAKKDLDDVLDMLDTASELATAIRTLMICKGVDCFRTVAELMAIVDPSGIAGTAAAYAYPKCDKV